MPKIEWNKDYIHRNSLITELRRQSIHEGMRYLFFTESGTVLDVKTKEILIDNGNGRTYWWIEEAWYPVYDDDNNYIGFYISSYETMRSPLSSRGMPFYNDYHAWNYEDFSRSDECA